MPKSDEIVKYTFLVLIKFNFYFEYEGCVIFKYRFFVIYSHIVYPLNFKQLLDTDTHTVNETLLDWEIFVQNLNAIIVYKINYRLIQNNFFKTHTQILNI